MYFKIIKGNTHFNQGEIYNLGSFCGSTLICLEGESDGRVIGREDIEPIDVEKQIECFINKKPYKLNSL